LRAPPGGATIITITHSLLTRVAAMPCDATYAHLFKVRSFYCFQNINDLIESLHSHRINIIIIISSTCSITSSLRPPAAADDDACADAAASSVEERSALQSKEILAIKK
jgi:hypothetical protein